MRNRGSIAVQETPDGTLSYTGDLSDFRIISRRIEGIEEEEHMCKKLSFWG